MSEERLRACVYLIDTYVRFKFFLLSVWLALIFP